MQIGRVLRLHAHPAGQRNHRKGRDHHERRQNAALQVRGERAKNLPASVHANQDRSFQAVAKLAKARQEKLDNTRGEVDLSALFDADSD